MATRATARERNVGVFIDAENLFKGYGKLEIPDVSMADIIDLVRSEADERAGAGSVAVAHAYADWNRLGLDDYRRDVERSGIRPMQVFAAGAPTKNAADIELVVDALRFAAERETIEVYVIISGDGDFVPLVRRLHELGKFVVVATLAAHDVNSLLEQEADLFVAAIPTPADHPAEQKPPEKKPPEKKPAEKKSPEKQQAAKKETAKKPAEKKAKKDTSSKRAEPATSGPPNWHDLAGKIGVVRPGPASSPEEYQEAVKTLLETPAFHSYCDKLVAHGGTLPMLSMALRAAAPKLSPSAVGVRNLSRALRFALAGTRYALAQGPDDAQPRLVRRRSKPADMLPDLPLEQIRGGSAH